MVKTFSEYEAPPAIPHTQLVASIVSDVGEIMLRPNRLGQGFTLLDGAEGFGPPDVANDIVPLDGQRGAILATQRETEGDMFLPIKISSSSKAEVRRLKDRLSKVLKPAEGTARVVLLDPATGVGRYRDVAYRDGLLSPMWQSPLSAAFGVTVDFMDPWAYSLQEFEQTLDVAPGATGGMRTPVRFPIRFSRTPGARSRWATNEGTDPAPVTLQFNGPVTDPLVALEGHWTFRVTGTLAWDEYLVVDPRDRTALVFSTTRADVRRAAYRMIRSGSKFSDLLLPPGQHSLRFEAVDPTFQASVKVTWPSTYRSME